MKQMVSSNIIQELEEHMMIIINQNADREYELAHYRNVCKYSSELARIRNLKEDRAMIAAILHDIGRLFPNHAKNHAKASAVIASEILQERSLKEKLIDKICKTIKNHSNKILVDQPYDELLKDADSLAHRDEVGYEGLRWMEQIRCDYAYETCHNQRLFSIKLPEMNPLILEKVIELQEKLSLEQKEMFQKNNVHRIRILSNQLRTLCCVIESQNLGESDKLSDLHKIVQKIYRKTAKLRESQVYLGILPETLDWMEERRFLKNLIKTEETKIYQKNRCKKLGDVSSLLIQNPELENVQWFVNQLILTIQKKMRYLDSDDINYIHKIRIIGKKLLYLYEVGLLEMNPNFLEVLQSLHGEIGTNHDLLAVNQLFFKKNRTFWLQDQLQSNNEEIKRDLFRLKIILSKYL